MLKSVLIANRSEIACRVIATARRLGLRTVAVYSDADANARHVRAADESVWIGASPAAKSYLNGERIISAALAAGVEAIHPGYGFLAENADFAARCEAAGLVFVGPAPDTMRRIGDKASAKALAEAAGVPVVPGSAGATEDGAVLAAEAARIGYPLMIKAAAGGGGRGMRLVDGPRDLALSIESARREALAAFGDGRLLIERAVTRPRHIEIQIFGDRHGNVVHLFERECTLQRRHQKVIEEAPAHGMSVGLRARMTSAAVELAKAARYENAGTIEFLVEGGRLDATAPFYFIEANPRLQVEHPVTEAITGIDLVAWQFRVASGEPLPLAQAEITMSGHAVEARICAEDPDRGFLPDTGQILAFVLSPRDVRVESGIEAGAMISEHYDSLIFKAIAHATARDAALDRLHAWLAETVVLGVRTNMALLAALLDEDAVRAGEMDTSLAERIAGSSLTVEGDQNAAMARGIALLLEAGSARAPAAGSPWDAVDAFELGGERTLPRKVLVDNAPRDVVLTWRGGDLLIRIPGVDGAAIPVARELPAVYDPRVARALVLDRLRQVEVAWPRPVTDSGRGQAAGAVAPISGRVARIDVAAGDSIKAGDVVAVVEAMKMEHVIVAAYAGRVARVLVEAGAQVANGTPLADIVADGARS